MSAEEAEGLIEEIESMAESADLPWAAQDFAESVVEKARSIGDTISERGEATMRQIEALQNMRDGLSRWFRD